MRQVLVPRDLAPVMPLRAPGASIVSLGGETMGTTWSVKLVQPASVSTAALCGGLERALASIVCEMSTWIGDSNISRFNDAAPGAWHAMPDDLMVVLRHALAVAEMSEGAYDLTAGALVELWGFGPHGRPHVPAEDAIAAARLRCGWQRIRVDGNRVYQPGGVRLDFSSIAKGFCGRQGVRLSPFARQARSSGRDRGRTQRLRYETGWWPMVGRFGIAAACGRQSRLAATRNSRRAARACDCDLRRQPALFPTRRAPAVPYD